MPKVTLHYRLHGDSHTPFYKGKKGNHHLTRSSLKMPLPLLAVPQTHIGRYPIVGNEFFHRLFGLNQLS